MSNLNPKLDSPFSLYLVLSFSTSMCLSKYLIVIDWVSEEFNIRKMEERRTRNIKVSIVYNWSNSSTANSSNYKVYTHRT